MPDQITTPESSRALIEEALSAAVEHHRRGEVQIAMEFYRHVLTIDPEHAGALHLAGLVAQQLGQSVTAVNLLERAVRQDQSNAEFHNSLAVALQAVGRVGEAVRAYQRALALNPRYTEARMNLGTALQSLGRNGEARYLYEQAIRENPEYADAYLNLGNVLGALGELLGAYAAFRRVLELRPADARAWFNIGHHYFDLGRAAEAVAAFREAVGAASGWREAQFAMQRAISMLHKRNAILEAEAAKAADIALRTLRTNMPSVLADAVAPPDQLGAIGPWADFLLEPSVQAAVEQRPAEHSHMVESVFAVTLEAVSESGGPFPLRIFELVPWWRGVCSRHGLTRAHDAETTLRAARQKLEARRAKVTSRENCLGSSYTDTWAGARAAELALLVVDGLLDSEDAAMRRFVLRLAEGPLAFPMWAAPAHVGRCLGRCGWYGATTGETLDTLHDAFVARLPSINVAMIDALVHLLFYTFECPRDHGTRIYERVVMPWMLRLYELRRLGEADFLTHWSFHIYGMKLTDEAQYDRFVHSYRNTALAAGRWLAAQLPAVPPPTQRHAPIRIGIINRGGSISTGAFHHLLPICSRLAQNGSRAIEPVIYVTQYYDEEIEREAARAGCRVVFLSDYGIELNAMLDRYVKLRELMARDGIDVAVWAHHPDSMFLAFGMRVAPIQIFYSQYLHPTVKGDEVDEVITYGSPALTTQRFLDVPWRVIPSALDNIREAPAAQAVAALRRRLLNGAFDTLIGTLARTEKIADVRFLGCVARILRSHPRTLFLWTGHHQDRTVQAFFEQQGISGQTRFVGWVDTLLHASALDVLLDSFPLCNGVTALQAMAAGTSVVSINRNTSFLGRDIVPIVEHATAPAVSEAAMLCEQIRSAFPTRDAVPAADDEDDYVRIATGLIDDPDLRRRTGSALKFVAENLYANEALMALLFEAHILDLVRKEHALGDAA